MCSSKEPLRVLISEAVSLPSDLDPEIAFVVKPDLWRFPRKFSQELLEADGLIVRNQSRVEAALLKGAPKLKVVGRLGVGLDNIDIQAAHAAGISVVFAPQSSTVAVAEYCLAQIFNILRKLPQAMQSAKSGEWLRSQYTGRDLSEVNIGLVGFGSIAQALADRLLKLGGNVIAATRSPEEIPPSCRAVSLEQLLAEADIVSLHVPGGPETHHMIGSEQFEIMKPTAWLINTARGSVLDEADLLEALLNGKIDGAVVDVREQEPPAVGQLDQLPNFLQTPHIAAFSQASQAGVNQVVFQGVAAVLRGERPAGLVPGT